MKPTTRYAHASPALAIMVEARNDGDEPRYLIARNAVVVAFLPEVARIIRQSREWRSLGVDLREDAAQYGALGLIAACRTYDPAKGAFSTHATLWISQEIARGMTHARGVMTVNIRLRRSIAAEGARKGEEPNYPRRAPRDVECIASAGSGYGGVSARDRKTPRSEAIDVIDGH